MYQFFSSILLLTRVTSALTSNRKSDRKDGIGEVRCHACLPGIFEKITKNYGK